MSEEVTRLKNAFYMIQNGNSVARDHKTPLDTLSPHSKSKEARTYFSLFTKALDEAGLRSNSVDIRIPRTNDGRSFRGDPSKPLGLSIVFDLMSQPRPPKNPAPYGFVGPLSERELFTQNNPAGAAFLEALGVDPVHADQIRLNIKHIEGKFVRDDNDPDGYRYDGGSYITSLEIPFESAVLNQVVAVLDRKVAEREDFEKRLEKNPIGNYLLSLSEEARYDNDNEPGGSHNTLSPA